MSGFLILLSLGSPSFSLLSSAVAASAGSSVAVFQHSSKLH